LEESFINSFGLFNAITVDDEVFVVVDAVLGNAMVVDAVDVDAVVVDILVCSVVVDSVVCSIVVDSSIVDSVSVDSSIEVFSEFSTDSITKSVHCSSSEPSKHWLTPSHLLPIFIQAPYLHLNAYFGHL